ncbi:hypothetical protein WN51_12249 [Melipona quadrifasciata]|uniref:Uncharacterized protein n=1 Tax=Melipona quadrifasciata TaxID=166423 RepID=A0A0M9A1N7_9HYME|nr:hypothetical protein WN51_12249 [Melipona quadrifasciata]
MYLVVDIVPTNSKERESDELLYMVRSLVMVRESVASVRDYDLTYDNDLVGYYNIENTCIKSYLSHKKHIIEAKFAKFLSESEYKSNSTSRVAPCNDQTVKSKKDAYCQTTFASVKPCHGSSKRNHVEQNRKENNSKDIKTIFTTTNFDDEKSKTNLESLGARAPRKRRIGRADKRSRKHDAENSSRKERSRTRCASAKRSVFNREAGRDPASEAARERKLVKRKRREAIKDKINSSTETFFDCDGVANFADGDSTRVPCRRRDGESEPLTFVENYDIRSILSNRNGEIHAKSNVNSPGGGTLRVSRQNYWVEDKTSESVILGNVKKRLEEDYDDYFSVDNDLFLDAEDPSDVVEVDGPPSTDRCTLQNDADEPRSVTMHQQMRQELTKRSIRASLTCTSSICFTNSDLSCNRSSYHTSMREQECSPSTSIESRPANNVPPSNLQSFGDNSFNNFLQTYFVDTGLSRENNPRTSGWENCFSNDVSFEDDEFLDRALVNSYTVCCYQRNSTPNLSNSSKLIAESLDSGILTDCSRDQLRIASNEDVIRLGGRSEERVKQGRKRQARRSDLLPACDLNTDSSYSDDSLNRRVDIVVKKFTDSLILSERRARTKLRSMGNSSGHGQARKRRKGQYSLRIIFHAVEKTNVSILRENDLSLNTLYEKKYVTDFTLSKKADDISRRVQFLANELSLILRKGIIRHFSFDRKL